MAEAHKPTWFFDFPDLPPFYSQRNRYDLSTREGLFDALLPKVYASTRPRRHGYDLGIEIATLLVHKLDIPIKELQPLTRDRSKLKDVIKKIKETDLYYKLAIEEGRGNYTRERVLRSRLHLRLDELESDDKRKSNDDKRETIRQVLRQRVTQLGEGFMFKENVALTMSFSETTDTSISVPEEPNLLALDGPSIFGPPPPGGWFPGEVHLLASDESFRNQMEVAQKVFIDWFRETWHQGRRNGRSFLREKTWSIEDFSNEIVQRVDITRECEALLAQVSATKPTTSSSTFHPFPRLSAELRIRIWEMSFEPRIVEIQGSKRHHFDNVGAEAWRIHDDYMARNRDDEDLVVEDEEGDDWAYRDSGETRWYRDDKIQRDLYGSKLYRGLDTTPYLTIDKEDEAENQKWSAQPAYDCLKNFLDEGAVTEAMFETLLATERYKTPLVDAIPPESSLDSVIEGDSWIDRPRPKPEMPGKQATRIAGILSKMEHTQNFKEYKWPQIPEYALFHTIFNKIENGKDDGEILKELKTAPESPPVMPSFWDEEEARKAVWRREHIDRTFVDPPDDPDPIHFSSPATPPPTLFACFESREIAQKYYDCAFNDRSLNLPGIYINYEIDTVLCVYETFGNTRIPHRGDEHAGGWLSGLWLWDRETQMKIRRMALSWDIVWSGCQVNSQPMNNIFPALEEVLIVINNSNENEREVSLYSGRFEKRDFKALFLRYELVGYHKTHLAFNAQFPDHDNEFFREPFKRYLDAPAWVPGLLVNTLEQYFLIGADS